MRLVRLHVHMVHGAIERLPAAAGGESERRGLLVRVVDADGCTGQGEASPLPGYSRDTVDACERQLAAIEVADLPAPDGATAEDWMDRVHAKTRLPPAARFALETALLDWWGRRQGVSIARLLGPSAPRRVPLAALASDVAAARAAHRRGVRTFKVKISGAHFEAGLAFARTLADAVGPGVRWRFDANGTLEPASVRARLAALAPFDPEYVEEPLPWPAFATLTASPVPLAADESLAEPAAWPALASVCRAVVLKPTLLGGLCECLRRARSAAARGLGVAVTHTFDGPIALAAAAELAAALPDAPLACGLDRHAGLAAWPRVAIPQIGASHAMSADRPGLGLPDLLADRT